LSLDIQALGGVMTKLIEKNTTIPTKAAQAEAGSPTPEAGSKDDVVDAEFEEVDDDNKM